MRLMLLSGLALLAACTSGAVNLTVTTFPDGSGNVSAVRFAMAERPSPAAAVFKGLESGVDMKVEVFGGPFRKISNLDIGGIKCELTELEQGFRLTSRIPCSPSADWYRGLGLTHKDLEALREFAAQQKTIDAATEGGSVSVTPPFLDNPTFVFEVQLPGPVTANRLEGRATPSTWTLEPTGKGINGKERKARIAIPLEEILEGTIGELTWVVESAPLDDESRKAWDKNRRTLEAGK